MLNSARRLRAPWGCCSIGLLLWSCGDSGAGTTKNANPAVDAGEPHAHDDAQVPDEPDAGPDAGPDAQPGTVTAGALRSACEAACEAQSACLEISDSVCAGDCAEQARSLAEGCRDEAIAEQRCLESLSCEDAMAYAVEGRRAHAECGAAARAYFKVCSLGEGKTPAACTALCKRYQTCDALDISLGACEEQCILQGTDLANASGDACGDAFLTFMACSADAECAEVRELASDQIAPRACEPQLTAMEQACP
jgi:hypothetical protein